jgi:hypothetical protein
MFKLFSKLMLKKFLNFFHLRVYYKMKSPLFLFYSSAFKCLSVDKRSYITKYLSERCWSPNHVLILLTLNLPSLLLLMFLVPIIIFSKVRSGLKKGSIPSEYAYMIQGYRLQYYYWDFCLMIQKYLVIVVTIFIDSPFIIMFLVNLVTFSSSFLQIQNKPYRLASLNRTALFSKLTSHITVFCTLSIIIENNLAFGSFIVFLMTFTNVLFFSFWILNFIGTVKRLRKLFHKFLVKLDIDYPDPEEYSPDFTIKSPTNKTNRSSASKNPQSNIDSTNNKGTYSFGDMLSKNPKLTVNNYVS